MKSERRLVTLALCGLAIASPVLAEEGRGNNGHSAKRADVTGPGHGFVMSEMLLPASTTQAVDLGLDIDDDDQVDNAFGQLLSSLSNSLGLDIQVSVDEHIQKGTVIHLLNFRTVDFDSADESALWVFNGGNPSTAPCDGESDLICGNHLDGSTTFDVIPKVRPEPMVGPIVSGEFTGGPGLFRVALPFLNRTMPIRLIGARSKANGDNTSLSGKLGGGITAEQIDNTVIPVMTESFSDIVTEDCTGTPDTTCCDSDSTGETLIEFFDQDPVDCQISEGEVRNNSLMSTLLQPDIDLLDQNGDFNPGQDGVNDSLSFGFGFDSVGADFELVIFLDSFES